MHHEALVINTYTVHVESITVECVYLHAYMHGVQIVFGSSRDTCVYVLCGRSLPRPLSVVTRVLTLEGCFHFKQSVRLETDRTSVYKLTFHR